MKNLEKKTMEEIKSSRKKFKELGQEMLDRNITWEEFQDHVSKKLENADPKEASKFDKPGIDQMINKTGFSLAELMFSQQVWDAAIKGDRQAFEVVRDTVGEKPSNDVNFNDESDAVKRMSNEELKKRIQLLKELEGEDDTE